PPRRLCAPRLPLPVRADRTARGVQLQREPLRDVPLHRLDGKWYGQVFSDYQIRDALTTTLKVAAEVTVVSTIVGTAAAFPLVRSRLPFRTGIRVGMTLPIMIPGLLIGVSLLVFFTNVLHEQLSPTTAAIGQSVYTTPFVLLLVAARLQGF